MSFVLEAELRADLGKGASRRLRHADKLPAIIYGGDKEPVSITLEHAKVLHAQNDDAFYGAELTIKLAGQEEKVKVQDVQRHPFKPKLVHLDFVRV